jgi:transposase-like protein
MNAIPKREQDPIAAELAGIWKQPTKEQALTELAAFKAKYHQRYPEAVRSLSEDEEHKRDLLRLPTGHASLYPQYQCD